MSGGNGFRRLFAALSLLLVLAACSGEKNGCGRLASPEAVDKPHTSRNVILFIGDGMGFEQVKAAGLYLHGTAGTLPFEAFPYKAEMSTGEICGGITDSAAAGTAMATGVKVGRGVLSVALPGDGGVLKTVTEYFKEQGKSTGLVSTTYITHATPASFGAHEASRGAFEGVASDYLTDSRPNVLFGGARHLTPQAAQEEGYTVVRDRAELLALDTETAEQVSGQFGNDHLPFEFDGLKGLPHLSEMTGVALRILDNDPDGFFLMVEGGRIDHAGHANSIVHSIFETVEFSKAVQKAVEWAEGREDTLIIVTADHETGGLKVWKGRGVHREPSVTWSTTDHTPARVPVYAWGAKAGRVKGTLDNTDIFDIIMR